MIVRVERTVPFPRDAVYTWWTDFREDDHLSHHSPASSRREILRREGNQVWLRDRARRPVPLTLDEHVVLDPPNGYAVEVHYPATDVRYNYRFEPTTGGTRIVLLADLTSRHVGRPLARIFAGRILRYAERDTDFHVRRISEDLGERPEAVIRPASDLAPRR